MTLEHPNQHSPAASALQLEQLVDLMQKQLDLAQSTGHVLDAILGILKVVEDNYRRQRDTRPH